MSMTLTEAMQALGTTPESVTAKLREKGIRGYRRIAHSCPLAKYLKQECQREDATIGTSANLYKGGSLNPDESYILPDGVKVWVQEFDDGKHPEFYPDGVDYRYGG